MQIKNYGFIPSVRTPDNYVLGASPMPFIVFKEDGIWPSPEKEMQMKNGTETSNCTAFNLCAQVEVFMKEVYGLNVNYSDRFLGVMAGTKPPGNDPQKVYQTAREVGFIPDEMMPFSDDIQSAEEYFSWKGVDKEACVAEGLKWKERWEFFHEWCIDDGQKDDEKIHNLKVAHKSSPLCREVYAWYADERGVYVALGQPNHWTFQKAQQEYAKISDSYEPTEKDVEQDTNFCKRIYIAKKDVHNSPASKSNWLYNIIKWIMSLIK